MPEPKGGEVSYAFFRLIEPLVGDQLRRFRELKRKRYELENRRRSLEREVATTEQEIKRLAGEIPTLEGASVRYMGLGGLAALLGLLMLPARDLMGFASLLLLIGFALLLYGLSKRSEASRKTAWLNELYVKREELLKELERASRELSAVTSALSSFRLSSVKLRAFRCFVPVLLTRNPMGNGALVIAPWSRGVPARLIVVSNPEAVEEARRVLALGENLYFETAVRGKDSGYKVVEGFRKLNMWEKILESRAPESLLAEYIARSYSTLRTGVEAGEEVLKLERLDQGSRELLKRLREGASAANAGWVPDGEIALLKEERDRLYDLAEAVKNLSELRQYLAEAREIAARKEVYESVVGIAVREMIARTLPLDDVALSYAYRTIYCKKCAAGLVEEYVKQIDLRQFVYDNILGGVDKDPDIISPDPEVAEYVFGEWKKIDENVYRSLPLPGVRGDEPFEELVAKHKEALRIYALPLTGAEESVGVEWRSAFEPPILRCDRCGSTLLPDKAESATALLNLQLPVIKGYVALLYEKGREITEKSREIISSVNSARLHKDQRKTTLGIYRQILEEYEREKLRLEREIIESEKHLEDLRKVLIPLLGAPATMSLLDALSQADVQLKEQLELAISTISRGDRK